jgi:hypothetical protein
VFYTVRVDVQDSQTSQVLSMTSVPVGYLVLQNPTFSVNVPNTITAPNTYGAWQLTVVVYIFANFEFVANGIDASAVDQVSLQVGSVQTTTTAAVQTSVATVTASVSATTTSATQSSIIQSPSPMSVSQQVDQTAMVLVLAVLAVAIVAFAIVLRAKRRTQ